MVAISFESLPVAIGLWLILYIADYYLTLYGRRLWHQNAKDLLTFQGSYELNPYYQRDVDANKRVSRRFIFMLVFGILWMLLMWGATHYMNISQVFPAAVGFLILMEVIVLSGHVQNIRLFKSASITGAIEGHISYARWVSMDASAWKFGYWGVFFLVVALLMGNWFFCGWRIILLV
ncbi:MAG: hypothetical protein ABI970_06865 [Chloroflexota bacterium]